MDKASPLPDQVYILTQEDDYMSIDGGRMTRRKYIVFELWHRPHGKPDTASYRYYVDGKESESWNLRGDAFVPLRMFSVDHARENWDYLVSRNWKQTSMVVIA